MRTLLAIGSLLAALPALAQEVPGLDLSAPPRPQKPAREETTEVPALDLSAPSPEPAKAEPPAAVLPFSEKDVALGDKVKAVQRKGFLKRGRFEVAPIFAITVNDAFYQKFGGGLRLAYNIHDSFAIAVRGLTYRKPAWKNPRDWQPAPVRSDAGKEGKIAFGSQLLSSQIYDQVMLDGIWSPIYGKVNFLDRGIIHFDLFLAAGVGLVWTASTEAPRNDSPPIATDIGGGLRFYPKDWMAFELGMMATLYPDRPQPDLPATLQKVFVLQLGVSFFFPTSFEYVYP